MAEREVARSKMALSGTLVSGCTEGVVVMRAPLAKYVGAPEVPAVGATCSFCRLRPPDGVNSETAFWMRLDALRTSLLLGPR
jgi:hypothetical protein